MYNIIITTPCFFTGFSISVKFPLDLSWSLLSKHHNYYNITLMLKTLSTLHRRHVKNATRRWPKLKFSAHSPRGGRRRLSSLLPSPMTPPLPPAVRVCQWLYTARTKCFPLHTHVIHVLRIRFGILLHQYIFLFFIFFINTVWTI